MLDSPSNLDYQGAVHKDNRTFNGKARSLPNRAHSQYTVLAVAAHGADIPWTSLGMEPSAYYRSASLTAPVAGQADLVIHSPCSPVHGRHSVVSGLIPTAYRHRGVFPFDWVHDCPAHIMVPEQRLQAELGHTSMSADALITRLI